MRREIGMLGKKIASFLGIVAFFFGMSHGGHAEISKTELESYPIQMMPLGVSRDFSIKELLGRVEIYLNGFRSMHAHFKQEDPDGAIRFGELYIQKPGLMRIAYRGLKGLLIVSDGTWLSYDDKALDQVSYVPLHTTPASLILKDKFDFKDTLVDKVEFMP